MITVKLMEHELGPTQGQAVYLYSTTFYAGGGVVGTDCCLAMAEPREDDDDDGGVAPSFFSNTSAALRCEFLPGGDFKEASSFLDADGSGFL